MTNPDYHHHPVRQHRGYRFKERHPGHWQLEVEVDGAQLVWHLHAMADGYWTTSDDIAQLTAPDGIASTRHSDWNTAASDAVDRLAAILAQTADNTIPPPLDSDLTEVLDGLTMPGTTMARLGLASVGAWCRRAVEGALELERLAIEVMAVCPPHLRAVIDQELERRRQLFADVGKGDGHQAALASVKDDLIAGRMS